MLISPRKGCCHSIFEFSLRLASKKVRSSAQYVTASTFAGVPLASLDGFTQGKLMTAFARTSHLRLRAVHPDAVFRDAVALKCASTASSAVRTWRTTIGSVMRGG